MKNTRIPSFVSTLKFAIVFLWSTTILAGDLRSRDDGGEGAPICQALLKRANEYSGHNSPDTRCSPWDIFSSYPEFIEPPWQKLDINEHKELLFKLMRSAYAEYPPNLSSELIQQNDAKYHKMVDDFIMAGGEMRMWKVKPGILNFTPGTKSKEPIDEQIIVELGIAPELSTVCTNTAHTTWVGSNYVISHDLDGEIFRSSIFRTGTRDHYAASELRTSHFFLYEGQPIILNSEEIFRFSSGHLNQICNLRFIKRK